LQSWRQIVAPGAGGDADKGGGLIDRICRGERDAVPPVAPHHLDSDRDTGCREAGGMQRSNLVRGRPGDGRPGGDIDGVGASHGGRRLLDIVDKGDDGEGRVLGVIERGDGQLVEVIIG